MTHQPALGYFCGWPTRAKVGGGPIHGNPHPFPEITGIILPFTVVVQLLWVSPVTLQPHGLQHTRPPCPTPSPRVCSKSCPLSQWCHPTISSSVTPFSSCPQSFPISGSFPMSQLFATGGQSTGASVLLASPPLAYEFTRPTKTKLYFGASWWPTLWEVCFSLS